MTSQKWKEDVSFRAVNGNSGQLIRIEPPLVHTVAYLTGGLKQLYQQIKNKCVPETSEYGKYTGSSGVFKAKECMPLLGFRYKFLEVIGQGQSAVFIKAKDTFRDNKLVAIKVLHAHYHMLGTQETDCIRRLNQADPYQVSGTLKLLNYLTFDDHYCMVFELLQSKPITVYFEHCHKQATAIPLLRQITLKLLQALGFLDQQDVIHADLKPENILLKTDSDLKSAKIVDFGNAIHCVHEELSLYYNDFELQTLFYRAPEVMFGLPFGTEIDVWSLGCILAELYTGKPLFPGSDKCHVLQKTTRLLGPLPREKFKKGKFFNELSSFTEKMYTKKDNTETLMKHLKCTDVAFANFLSRLLKYDPSERMTVPEAAQHPFLSPEFGFAFLLPKGCGTGGYPKLHVTESTYSYRPMISDRIKRQHLSPKELLKHGTLDQYKEEIDPVKSRQVAEVVPFRKTPSPTEISTGEIERSGANFWSQPRHNFSQSSQMNRSNYTAPSPRQTNLPRSENVIKREHLASNTFTDESESTIEQSEVIRLESYEEVDTSSPTKNVRQRNILQNPQYDEIDISSPINNVRQRNLPQTPQLYSDMSRESYQSDSSALSSGDETIIVSRKRRMGTPGSCVQSKVMRQQKYQKQTSSKKGRKRKCEDVYEVSRPIVVTSHPIVGADKCRLNIVTATMKTEELEENSSSEDSDQYEDLSSSHVMSGPILRNTQEGETILHAPHIEKQESDRGSLTERISSLYNDIHTHEEKMYTSESSDEEITLESFTEMSDKEKLIRDWKSRESSLFDSSPNIHKREANKMRILNFRRHNKENGHELIENNAEVSSNSNCLQIPGQCVEKSRSPMSHKVHNEENMNSLKGQDEFWSCSSDEKQEFDTVGLTSSNTKKVKKRLLYTDNHRNSIYLEQSPSDNNGTKRCNSDFKSQHKKAFDKSPLRGFDGVNQAKIQNLGSQKFNTVKQNTNEIGEVKLQYFNSGEHKRVKHNIVRGFDSKAMDGIKANKGKLPKDKKCFIPKETELYHKRLTGLDSTGQSPPQADVDHKHSNSRSIAHQEECRNQSGNLRTANRRKIRKSKVEAQGKIERIVKEEEIEYHGQNHESHNHLQMAADEFCFDCSIKSPKIKEQVAPGAKTMKGFKKIKGDVSCDKTVCRSMMQGIINTLKDSPGQKSISSQNYPQKTFPSKLGGEQTFHRNSVKNKSNRQPSVMDDSVLLFQTIDDQKYEKKTDVIHRWNT